MIRNSQNIIINRPLSDVWAFLMKVENYRLWAPNVSEITATDELNLGSQISFLSTSYGRNTIMTAEVTSNDGRSSFTIKSEYGPIAFEASYSLKESGKSTILSHESCAEVGNFFRLAESLLKSSSHNNSEASLKTVKQILEARIDQVAD